MKLSICIPTHHGRRDALQELLESIISDITQFRLESSIQICISDNASSDGTEALVKNHIDACPCKIKYNRLSTNTGIRNFFTVIEMADAEYCWLVGSDDAIIPIGINRVLQFLEAFPKISGVTINKLNFDRSLSHFIGPDHDQVLPPDPNNSRIIVGESEILDSLFIPFCYISSQVFRKPLWNAVVTHQGIEKILGFRHFPHTFVLSDMAKRSGAWGWMANYCVVQRLENFSFMSEISARELDYAEQFTTDLECIAHNVFGGKNKSYFIAMEKLYYLYWNPWLALKYISHPMIPNSDIVETIRKCKSWFGHCIFFWLTTYPVFIFPRQFSRLTFLAAIKFHSRITKIPLLAPIIAVARKTLHLALRLLGIERRNPFPRDDLQTAVDSFLQMRSRAQTKCKSI